MAHRKNQWDQKDLSRSERPSLLHYTVFLPSIGVFLFFAGRIWNQMSEYRVGVKEYKASMARSGNAGHDLSEMKSLSFYETGVDVGIEDSVVVWMTCTSSDQDRLQICGKLLSEEKRQSVTGSLKIIRKDVER